MFFLSTVNILIFLKIRLPRGYHFRKHFMIKKRRISVTKTNKLEKSQFNFNLFSIKTSLSIKLYQNKSTIWPWQTNKKLYFVLFRIYLFEIIISFK